MSMFDQFNNFFRVGNTISQSSNTQPDDVLKTKSALAQTGDYKVPDYGITESLTRQMHSCLFDEIHSFHSGDT